MSPVVFSPLERKKPICYNTMNLRGGIVVNEFSSFCAANDGSVACRTRFAVVARKQMSHQLIDLLVLAACELGVL